MTAASQPYVILVEFDLKPSIAGKFMPLMRENALRSLADEPGCLVFDVHLHKDAPDRVVLYEIYIDREAFEAHLVAPHFLSFDAAVADHILAKRVTELVPVTTPGGSMRSGNETKEAIIR